jgi:outer membrane protein OmpA-like peptidoglycan-associated protein
VKSFFTSDLVSKTAASLGESESGVSKAITGAIPAVLTGLMSKFSSGGSGLPDFIKNAISGDGGIASGGGLLQSLFGDKLGNITQTIARFAGIKDASAATVLNLAAPAAVDSVGRYAKENNLDATGISAFLHKQKDAILGAVPSGLNLAGALGLGSLGQLGGKLSEAFSGGGTSISNSAASAVHYAEGKAAKAGNGKLLFPILVLALIALLAWFFFKGKCNNSIADITPGLLKDSTLPSVAAQAKGTLDSLTGNFIYNTGNSIKINLPGNGGTIEVGEHSTEAALYNFLTDPAQKIDTGKGNWFDFTNVRFKTGGVEISDESLAQLKNLVLIIKAFPAATFKLGGYTDNTGDAAANVALSQKRADAVLAWLKQSGVTETQLTGAKGYGPEFPVGDNATAEGRAMNRRVSVNVKSK